MSRWDIPPLCSEYPSMLPSLNPIHRPSLPGPNPPPAGHESRIHWCDRHDRRSRPKVVGNPIGRLTAEAAKPFPVTARPRPVRASSPGRYLPADQEHSFTKICIRGASGRTGHATPRRAAARAEALVHSSDGHDAETVTDVVISSEVPPRPVRSQSCGAISTCAGEAFLSKSIPTHLVPIPCL